MTIWTGVTLSPERVDELVPGLVAGDEAATEELILGYVAYIRTLLRESPEEHFSVGIEAMVALIRKYQGVQKEHENFTGLVKTRVLGAVHDYRCSDFLVPIPRGAYIGQRFQLPPKPSNGKASMEHHKRKEKYLQLKEALECLGEQERTVLVLRSESYTLEDVCMQLGLPIARVQRIEQRAQSNMRKLMGA